MAEAAVFNFGATGSDELVIDTTRLTFAGPLDLAGIVSIARWAASQGMSVTLKVPGDREVASYLQRMDVLQHMPPRTQVIGRVPPDDRTDRRGRLLEVTPLNGDNANQLSERIGPLVRDFYAAQRAQGGALVFGACGELLSNAVDHGASDAGAS